MTPERSANSPLDRKPKKARANYDVDPYAGAGDTSENPALAVMCPNPTCDTELVIPPDAVGAWVECPTCGLQFQAPSPGSPEIVTPGDLAAATARADSAADARAADALAALVGRPEPGPPEVAPVAVESLQEPIYGAPAQGPGAIRIDAAAPAAAPLQATTPDGAEPEADEPEAIEVAPAAPAPAPLSAPAPVIDASAGRSPPRGAPGTEALDLLAQAAAAQSVTPVAAPGYPPPPAPSGAGPVPPSAAGTKPPVYIDLPDPAAARATYAPRARQGSDLATTWIVSLVAGAGVVGAAFAIGEPFLAFGAVLFVGFAAAKSVAASRSAGPGRYPY